MPRNSSGASKGNNRLPVLWTGETSSANPEQPDPTDYEQQVEQEITADLDLAEKWRRAFELHDTGLTYRDIASQMGVSVSAAYRYVERHLQVQAPVPAVDDYRWRQLARIKMVRAGIIREARLAPREDKPWHYAAGPLMKLDEREAVLTGLDRVPPPDRFAGMSDEELERFASGG